MQVHASYTTAFHTNLKSTPTDTRAPLPKAREQQVALEEMLGNLRADPLIGARISDNDDGTYSFDMTAGGWSDKAFVASAIVTELNGGRYDTTRSLSQVLPSQGDMQLFKELTGYNLLILGGEPVVLDKSGFPPNLGHQRIVQQALELVSEIAALRTNGSLQGELNADNLGAFLSEATISPSYRDMVHTLVNLLRDKAGVDTAATQSVSPEDNEIAALMTMISV